MNDKNPIALSAYEDLADAYAANIDTKPHNAYYDKPAVLSLLPDVHGLDVFDAGCGPGAYAEELIKRGANVTAVDVSPKMVAYAESRLGDNAKVLLADITEPISFLDDEAVDLIICPLVLEYVKNLKQVYLEFFRILRKKGKFVFSVQHPFFDFTYFKSQNYFKTEEVGSTWGGFGKKVFVPCYRRPLTEIINPLLEVGFTLEKVLEPLPTDDFKKADIKHYEELTKEPAFICFRAGK